jgi:hypothetical protein
VWAPAKIMSWLYGLNVESPAFQLLIAEDAATWLPLSRGFGLRMLEKARIFERTAGGWQ